MFKGKQAVRWVEDLKKREWGGRLPIALVFPEKKELALSTLGWQKIYRELVKLDDFVVESFVGQGSEKDLFSLENRTPLSSFPFIAFSLNFELDTLFFLKFLSTLNLPLKASARKEDFPLIMGGGPLTFLNPFPFLPALDFAFVGEGEQAFIELMLKIKGAYLNGAGKKEVLQIAYSNPYVLTLKKAAKKAIYTQKLTPTYSFFISSKSYFPDSLLLEVNRGCIYNCRFCAASFIYRPFRELELTQAKEIVEKTNPRKVGLVGTALTDWPYLQDFLFWLHDKKIKFSLSSLRLNKLNYDFLYFLRKVGTRSITIAVEGISKRIRRAINKKFSEKIFFQVIEDLSKLQFNKLKLYFILGFPQEDTQDFLELEDFLKKVQLARKIGKGKKNKGIEVINISASFLTPKPWTPLQWLRLLSEQELETRGKLFKQIIAKFPGIKVSVENPLLARIQGLLARGDEKLFFFLEDALKLNSWIKAYKQHREKLEKYAEQRKKEENFPWDAIDMGIKKDYLYEEYLKFWQEKQSPNCLKGCFSCNRCTLENLFEVEK